MQLIVFHLSLTSSFVVLNLSQFQLYVFRLSLLLKNPQGDFITALDNLIHKQMFPPRNQDNAGSKFIMNFTIFTPWSTKTRNDFITLAC